MVNWNDLTNRFNNSFDVSDVIDGAKNHLKNFLFIDGEGKGIIDLKLDIVGDETISADCDVTDHYVESNTAYQDQISIKPKIYTIAGEVGELVWYQKDAYSQQIGQVAQRLEGVISFLPIRSRSFNQMKKKAMKVAQWIDTASNVASKISNLSSIGNNQQQAFLRLTEIRDTRRPISVRSPWGILESYVITSLKLTQTKDTKDKSLISIVLKEFRTTSVSTVKYDAEKYQKNAAIENSPVSNNGATDGQDISIAKIATKDDVKEYGVLKEGDEFSVEEDILCKMDKESDSVWYYKVEETETGQKITTIEDESYATSACANKIYTQFYME